MSTSYEHKPLFINGYPHSVRVVVRNEGEVQEIFNVASKVAKSRDAINKRVKRKLEAIMSRDIFILGNR
jgi:hypothetical protein